LGLPRGRLDRSEWLTGQPGSTLVMAAPGSRRFSNEALGAWYCAFEIETAIPETVYHHTKRLGRSASGFRHVTQVREIVARSMPRSATSGGLRDSHPELYDPEELRGFPTFWGGTAPRRGKRNRLYERQPTDRHQLGSLPRLLPPIVEGDHFHYRWTGSPTAAVVKLTGIGGAVP
jgi:hypothetical protein